MKSFNLVITAHSARYIQYYKDLREKLEREFPSVRLHLLFSEKPSEKVMDVPENFHFLLDAGFTDLLNQKIDKDSVLKSLEKSVADVPVDLHRSDIRGLIHLRTQDMIALEQSELTRSVSEFFDKNTPHLVFVSSGTNILHSVVYYLAHARGAKTYRVHNYLNLNLNLEGQRVWFCSNNEMRLSREPEDTFDYEEHQVRERVRLLHRAVKDRLFRLDEISKKFRRRRMPVTFGQLARDVLRVCYYRLPVHGGGTLARLGANDSRDRLRVLVNGRRNRALTLTPDQLSEKYVLFALNTPYDSQILVRAPEYRDFPSLIEIVAGMVPYGYDLVLREHPAFLGMLDHGRLKGIQARHPHVRLVSSDVPFPEVLCRARGVLIINNTAFVDAILAGKPVISLAKGYFKGKGLTREVGPLRDLRQAFRELVTGQLDGDMRPKLEEVMSELFQETFPGPDVRHDDKTAMINEGILAKLRRIRSVYGSLEAFALNRKREGVGGSV